MLQFSLFAQTDSLFIEPSENFPNNKDEILNTPTPPLDSSAKVLISDIFFVGNKKTKNNILLRELDFKKGDSLSIKQVFEQLEMNKNRIFNTGLFISVEVLPVIKKNEIELIFMLKERWYIFPLPIFELGDRSFNEWWYQRDRDFSRTNYGIHFEHKNFRGRNERLKLLWQEGFTPKYELVYFIPYLNKKQKAGLGFAFQYSQNKQIAVFSENNKLIFLKSDERLRNMFKVEANYVYRVGFFLRHHFYLRYRIHEIADTVANINPNYLGLGKTQQRFFQFTYVLNHDKRNIQAYATEGSLTQFTLDKQGLMQHDDLDFLSASLAYSKYLKISNRWFASNSNRGFWTNKNDIPYLNLSPLGFGKNYLRGYDLNVIDATSHVFTKSTLKYKFFNYVFNLNSKLIFNQFKTFPITCFLTVFHDLGYTHNPMIQPENSKLMNRWLNGYGLGLDIVTFYDTSVRIEYSFNQFNQRGLFFHFSSDLK
ncbi:MAG: POTRA domain-containing protein [Cytophagales bacterium]